MECLSPFNIGFANFRLHCIYWQVVIIPAAYYINMYKNRLERNRY